MKIGLIGYGKMGKLIEEIALMRGHEVVGRVGADGNFAEVEAADICFEFTRPECAVDNIKKLAEMGKPIVVGTTGWEKDLKKVEALVQEFGIGLIYSPNFSIGVYLMMKIIAFSAEILNGFEDYDVAGIEYHHTQKRDRPSGTALMLSKIIEARMDRVDRLNFTSVRTGYIPGTHTVLFDSAQDRISISHESHNRRGFATGALKAAEWLKGKAGIFTLEDWLEDEIKGNLHCADHALHQ